MLQSSKLHDLVINEILWTLRAQQLLKIHIFQTGFYPSFFSLEFYPLPVTTHRLRILWHILEREPSMECARFPFCRSTCLEFCVAHFVNDFWQKEVLPSPYAFQVSFSSTKLLYNAVWPHSFTSSKPPRCKQPKTRVEM